MPQQSSAAAAVLMDPATEDKEEMEVKEMFEALRTEMASRDERASEQFQALRADIAGVEQRTTAAVAASEQRTNERLREMREETNRRFQEAREDMKDLREGMKDLREGIEEVRTESKAHVDKRFDDLRTDIQNATIIKHSRLGLAIAALVGIAVVGTFILQLLDALF